MRFMIIVRATPETEAETAPDGPAIDERSSPRWAPITRSCRSAGVLLDGNGLKPSAKGFRIRYDGAKRTSIDGPFAEVKELIAGYTLIQVKSREEALEWARRFPNPMGEGKPAEIEVRELYELEDFDHGGRGRTLPRDRRRRHASRLHTSDPPPNPEPTRRQDNACAGGREGEQGLGSRQDAGQGDAHARWAPSTRGSSMPA